MTGPAAMMPRFEGKVVLISGAASGIGAAAAQRFAAEGAVLALCDRRETAIRRLAETLELGPDQHQVAAFDVSDANAFTSFIEKIAQRFGRLDALINNAGMGSFGHVDELSPENWRRVMAVNVDSIFFAVRAALPHLRQSRGSVVNTASISGLYADPGLVAYNTSKAAVINMTRNMAVDHAAEGVRFNCVCPGGVATPMIKSHMEDAAFMAEYAKLVPMARLCLPEEVAAGIAFLASNDASFITGTTLMIDGGVTAQTGQPNFDRLYRERGWQKSALKLDD
jgi:meso-butanediol dehydrogenase/(S,S)-butanediol dehydrogenase/diacetyl reductase